MTFVRPEIAAIAGYAPGEQPQGGKFIKLNTNENPYPCSAAVNRAIATQLERGLGKYPVKDRVPEGSAGSSFRAGERNFG